MGARGRKEPEMTAGGIKKGPWLAEEDTVLMDYVKTYGPCDWSNIQSKGFLPRSGKSCRLRWVNKLKPDLKTGCKFSQIEEQTVINMQATIGNKWARIATHLPGRTDNDVKNFWSTRQKRLARLLNATLPARSRRKQANVPVFPEPLNSEPHVDSGDLHKDPGCLDITQFEEEYHNTQRVKAPYLVDTGDMQTAIIDYDLCLHSNYAPPHPPYDSLLLEPPPLVEYKDLVPDFDELSLPCNFGHTESSEAMQLPVEPTFYELEVGDDPVVNLEHARLPEPESSFGEFPDELIE